MKTIFIYLVLGLVPCLEGFSTSGPVLRRRALTHRGTTDVKVSMLGRNRPPAEQGRPLTRKRDIIRKCWGNVRLTTRNHAPSQIRLRMAKNGDSDPSEEKSKNILQTKLVDPVMARVEAFILAVKKRLPEKLVLLIEAVVEKCVNWFPSVRTIGLSFSAGAIFTLGAILVPIHSQVATLSEPVTLFETILGDLNRAYVDQVDTQKLFETGVSAMLRSLDPYTEFEGKQEAVDLNESIDGKYGGIGLVIAGATPKDLALLKESSSSSTGNEAVSGGSKLLPSDALRDNVELNDGDSVSSGKPVEIDEVEDDDEDGLSLDEVRRQIAKARDSGIRVVSAFEGYAFDYGMRVGDKLVVVDDTKLTQDTSVEDVRNLLRGVPGTSVDISFEREGVDGVQTVTIPRTIVRINDVKLATFIGNPKDGIGYIQLSGFASDAGKEIRSSILRLQTLAKEVSGETRSLQGLVLDLRGNPGGLLTSAVDVASSLVPNGSDIVSARGRGFPGILYRSRVDPILDPSTKLAVLINGGTASAAEIVSGAVQDLDAGIIIGSDRTFGKGLVQNVEELPYDTALKFTVAKYYTPSGRCIQGINYSEGGGLNAKNGGKYKADKVADKDRAVFYTSRGRQVRDGGGIEADYKVEAPVASALEITLLRSGLVSDFAAQWSRTHELTKNFEIDEETYREFQAFVNQKQREGDINLEVLYNRPINDLRKALRQSGYKGATKELENLKSTLVREIQRDFERYRTDIKEDIAQGILARYLPESMLIERSIKTDKQVLAAAKLLRNDGQFDKLLAKGSDIEAESASAGRLDGSTLNTASARTNDGAKLRMDW